MSAKRIRRVAKAYGKPSRQMAQKVHESAKRRGLIVGGGAWGSRGKFPHPDRSSAITFEEFNLELESW